MAMKQQQQQGQSQRQSPGAPRSKAFCDTCQREFVNSNALAMHCQTSSAHRINTPTYSTAASEPAKVTVGKSGPKQQQQQQQQQQQPEPEVNGVMESLARMALPKSNAFAKAREGDFWGGGVPLSLAEGRSSTRETMKGAAKGSSITPSSMHLPDGTKEEKNLKAPVESREPPPKIWGNWSFVPFAEREALLATLRAQCHPVERLSKEGYWTRIPTELDVDRTRKCNACGLALKKVERIQNPTCRFHPAKKLYQKGILRGRGPGTNKARCFYCQEAGTQGCVILAAHSFGAPNTKLRHMALSPAVEKHDAGKRKAVVLDCEMVGVLDANDREASEVVRVSAVDFLSGQVLVDTYVQPLERIISWRTRYSGVTRALLTDMKRQGRVVNGWRAARELLWRFIDRETVLIGHSLHNDLLVLGMVHGCVVDSCIVTRDAVGEGCARLWGLRALALQFLEREIQASSSGHDCLEDAFAAREVVLWCLRNDSQLRVWAAAEWEIIAQKQKEKQREKEKDREKSAALAVEGEMQLVEAC